MVLGTTIIARLPIFVDNNYYSTAIANCFYDVKPFAFSLASVAFNFFGILANSIQYAQHDYEYTVKTQGSNYFHVSMVTVTMKT